MILVCCFTPSYEHEIRSALDRLIGSTDTAAVSRQVAADLRGEAEGRHRVPEATAPTDEASIKKMVTSLIDDAVRIGASDIHIQLLEGPRPQDNALMIRLRVDGILRRHDFDLAAAHKPIINILIVRAEKAIDQLLAFQSGGFKHTVEGREIDVRLEVEPSQSGPTAVLRLLEQGSVPQMGALGFNTRQRQLIEAAIRSPFGLILATGPTASGKSTTLHSLLHERNTPDIDIHTSADERSSRK